MTYNILLGGARREAHITSVLRRTRAHVIALQEVSNPTFAMELAEHLGMRLVVGEASDSGGVNTAFLSRLPLHRWQNRTHPGRMLRGHLEVEVDTGGDTVPRLRLHCVHLAARFGERSKGEARRGRELTALLGDIDGQDAMPHALLGDFNALAPGDRLAATSFFRRMSELRRAKALVRHPTGLVGPRLLDGGGPGGDEVADAWLRAGIDPRLDVGIPVLPVVVFPLTAMVPRSRAVDGVLGSLIPRWTVERLLARGYSDAFRTLHPRAEGFTCATWCPAARIDYVFVDAHLRTRLRRCEVVGSRRWPDRETLTASDHHPLVVDLAI
ncbi:MAG: endonuclease/exonuclease/phosphatase family protein [Candidatus Dormibacteria bacterium]